MDEIKAQVRQLNASQLAELRTYISGLMFGGGGDIKAALGDGLLLEVFQESCRGFGLGFVSPSVRQIVNRREPTLKAFLAIAAPDASALIQRAILATGIGLLYDDLQANNRTINQRNLAFGLDRLPPVLDHAFPGYAACGRLAILVRAVQLK